MANPEHVELVKRGPDAIREWREANPNTLFDLGGANLREARLVAANLSGAHLLGADLMDADLRSANLVIANLCRANLKGAILTGANLRQTELIAADLSKADLGGAGCIKTDLERANLRGANLSRAEFSFADLRHADLSRSDLSGAGLMGTVLSGTKLVDANLRRVCLDATVIADVDLRTVKNLSEVRHAGPSHISIDTLVRSHGQIPEVFLRGCGLTLWETLQVKMYDPALTPHQISELQCKVFEQRTHGPFFLGGVFISYSRQDSSFVDTIYERLVKEGSPVWLDRHDAIAGDLQKQIARAIRLHDVVILVLSESSTNNDWVENELEMARQKERDEKRDVLCPVALDESWRAKLTAESSDRVLWRTLTKKAILDFSKWQTPHVFESEFGKLLRGLKINYEPKRGEA